MIIKVDVIVMPRFKVIIDYTKCNTCKLCIKLCPSNVFGLSEDNRRIVVENEESCLACLVCEKLCPRKAISIQPIINPEKLIDEEYKPPKVVTLL